jgi:clan AA aspartic protease
MRIGEVTAAKEAIVKLTVHGPQGQQQEVSAVLDTGYTEYVTLPPSTISALILPYQYSLPMYLADGNVIRVRVFDAVVHWMGQNRSIPIQETDGDVLLGMSLLYGSRHIVDVLDGGDVVVSNMP